MLIEAPIDPLVCERLLITGGGSKMKLTPLLATPPTVSRTLPLVVPVGTGTVMLVEVHDVGVPAVPLNATDEPPWGEPKPLPVMVTDVPTATVVGLMLV